MVTRKLILWDIDGTILLTHKTGRFTIQQTLEDLFDRTIDISSISFSGKTDPQIFREIFNQNDLAKDNHKEIYATALERYMALMRVNLAKRGVSVLPGVASLISYMADDDSYELSLLTGNVRPMAFLKLELAGLDQHFSYGAFGSDHEDRDELPAFALDRAHALTGHQFTGKNTIIIGDTPRDILCSKVIGAHAIAVCTGKYSREELADFQPTLLFDDLSDPKEVLDAISTLS